MKLFKPEFPAGERWFSNDKTFVCSLRNLAENVLSLSCLLVTVYLADDLAAWLDICFCFFFVVQQGLEHYRSFVCSVAFGVMIHACACLSQSTYIYLLCIFYGTQPLTTYTFYMKRTYLFKVILEHINAKQILVVLLQKGCRV